MAILDVYLATHTKEGFISKLQHSSEITHELAEVYYTEISELLISSNSVLATPTLKPKIPLKPQENLEMIYEFGEKTITIIFGSESIKNLIHPELAHANQLQTFSSFTYDFQILKDTNTLFLIKNQTYVGHYAVTDYHLLQGQFAMELINVLYDKEEADWVGTFHASTVCDDKEAIMIIGDSGNGKSTLSAVLMANGLDVLADDFTPLSAINTHVYRYPSGISVKEGAFEVLDDIYPDFKQLPTYTSPSKQVDMKYIPPLNSFEKSISHLPCTKIVYVKYDAQGTSEFKKVNTVDILPTLITESWVSPLAANAQLFLDWLQDLQCYELNYSDNNFAVSEFKKLFRS